MEHVLKTKSAQEGELQENKVFQFAPESERHRERSMGNFSCHVFDCEIANN